MLQRKAVSSCEAWKRRQGHGGLLIDGARQVGKTYLIREFARRHYDHVVEINLLENRRAAPLLDGAMDSDDLFMRITALADAEIVPDHTVIFLDEVQVAKEVVTAVKFLVQRPGIDVILSGSLLGTELRDIQSVPVGYLDTITLYPLDFEEFAWAMGVAPSLVETAADAFTRRRVAPDFLHERLLEVFHTYLIVGGMPAVVDSFRGARDLAEVRTIQANLRRLNRWDISKYAPDASDALIIKDIYDLIPAELNQQNKRFILKDMNQHARFNRYQEHFVWLAQAGVALPTYNVEAPTYPLKLNRSSNLFKLFMGDVGLLTSTFMKEAALDTLLRRPDVNYGAIYENAVAQELTRQGFDLYYYRNKKYGEIDFLVETPAGRIFPIEVKSGKDYKRHSALTNLLATTDYVLPEAIVLHDGNLQQEGRITYAPVYATSFFAGGLTHGQP